MVRKISKAVPGRGIVASKVIGNSKIEESERKFDRAREEERIEALVEPIWDAIYEKYADITGFSCYYGKFYYRDDLNAVLFEVRQYYSYGVSYLSFYRNPGRAKPNNPAMISLDASDAEVSEYVDRLIDELIDLIKRTFRSEFTRHSLDDDLSDDSVIDVIIMKARIDNKVRCRQFIHELLDSGEVVNDLEQYRDLKW